MFCPSCRDEFRPGFTRCAKCNVDLVEELDAPGAEPGQKTAPEVRMIRLADFCGFLSLDEARHARDDLRREQIRSEVVIREPPEVDWDGPVREEFWIRVDASRYADVEGILGDGAAADSPADGDQFDCSECGKSIAAAETFCPHCGARFDE